VSKLESHWIFLIPEIVVASSFVYLCPSHISISSEVSLTKAISLHCGSGASGYKISKVSS
jgi:hypothetical protein